MRPLILEFKEKPRMENTDFSIIEYSNELSLSVLKGSKKPAISFLNMDTETFTKTTGESTDSDNNLNMSLKRLLDTGTQTLTSTEASDSDNNAKMLSHILDTGTLTESVEPTDSDK